MKIYLDADGVLADFDRGLRDKYGIVNCKKNYATDWKDKTKEQAELANKVIWAMKQKGFFLNLPIMEGARELLKAAGKDSIILTALPEFSHDSQVEDEKKEYFKKNFKIYSKKRVIVCLRKDKQNYAKGNILVDDLEKNCKEWEAAGGKAILFKNYKQAIKELNDLTN